MLGKRTNQDRFQDQLHFDQFQINCDGFESKN